MFGTKKMLPPVLAEDLPEPQPLARLPVPLFVKITGIIAGLAVIVGLMRLPTALDLAISYQKGKNEMKAGKPQQAVPFLERVVKESDDPFEPKVDLARAYLATGDLRKCATILDGFQNRSVTKEEDEELTELAQKFESEAEKVRPK